MSTPTLIPTTTGGLLNLKILGTTILTIGCAYYAAYNTSELDFSQVFSGVWLALAIAFAIMGRPFLTVVISVAIPVTTTYLLKSQYPTAF